MSDRRRNDAARDAIDRLEAVRRCYGGLSFADPFEGVRLTLVQQIVAALYTDGLTVVEIAAALGCAAGTAKRHLEDIAVRIPGRGPRWDRITGWVRRRRALAQREPCEEMTT